MTLNSILTAIRRGETAKLKTGISAKDVTAKDEDGRTPLMHAVLGEHASAEMVGVLIGHGADVNAADKKQWTALHFAAQSQNVDIMRALLKAGAEVDARDKDGATPLLRSLMLNATPEAVRVLLEAGADPKAEDKWGSTSPLGMAKQKGKKDLEDLMLQSGGKA
jgi:ankyrin repeat protein